MSKLTDRAEGSSRPLWASFAVAVPVALIVQLLTGGSERLADAFLALLNAGPQPTVFEAYAARLLAHIVAPSVLVVAIMRSTRADRWLVLNRLSLALLVAASALVAIVAARGLALAAAGEAPFLYGTAATVFTGAIMSSLVAGLALLVASTLWTRWLADEHRFTRWLAILFRQV